MGSEEAPCSLPHHALVNCGHQTRYHLCSATSTLRLGTSLTLQPMNSLRIWRLTRQSDLLQILIKTWGLAVTSTASASVSKECTQDLAEEIPEPGTEMTMSFL